MADQTAHLLLLREADVVRLCGLAAAAQALEVVRGGGVVTGARTGSRLTAHVRAEGEEERTAWLDLGTEPQPACIWGCTCPRGQVAAGAAEERARPAPGGGLACMHVAALLTEWVRHPAGFREERGQEPASATPPAPRRAPASRDEAGARSTAETAARGESSIRREPNTLGDHLATLSTQALRTASRRVLGEGRDESHDEAGLRTALYTALTDPVLLAALCARFDDAALLLLRALAVSGGALTDAALAGVGERAGLTPAAQIVARHALRACCLLFPLGTDASPAGWTIPAEVLPHLDLGLGLAPRAPAPPPGGEQAGALASLRTLCLAITLMTHTLDHLQPTRVAAGSSGELPPLAGDAPDPALAVWARAAEVEPGVARLAHRLVRALLTGSGGQHPLLSLDRLPAEEWHCALKLGVEVWLSASSYAELADLHAAVAGPRVRTDPRHPAFALGALAAENRAARMRIVRLLRSLRPSVWYAVDDLIALLWTLDPSFLRGRQRAFETPAWWLADAETGRPLRPDSEDDWRRAEGRYIRALLEGPLRWLGLIEVARGKRATALFRRSAWMPYLLGERAEPPADAARLARDWGTAARPAGAAGLAIQPLTLGPTGMAPLDAWARVTGVRGGRLTWQLSPDRVAANLDAGQRPDDLLAWLEQLDTRDGTHAAPPAAALLERWLGRYGASRVERDVVIVEAQDEPGLREALAAVPELAAQARALAPGVAALPRRQAERLEQALAARGYLV